MRVVLFEKLLNDWNIMTTAGIASVWAEKYIYIYVHMYICHNRKGETHTNKLIIDSFFSCPLWASPSKSFEILVFFFSVQKKINTSFNSLHLIRQQKSKQKNAT